ncbi:MAG: hydroxymethylglutaryl-CoA synthase family protein [Candidatus Hodarchaeota archaeon]
MAHQKDDFFLNVGLDAIGFYAPRNRLSLDDLAIKRGVDPAKFRDGLLAKEIAVPDFGEDAVSMAVIAARNALIRGSVNPKKLDAIFVGSESLPYAVKSIASILSAFLNVNENVITGDTLHACAGATLGLLNAVGLVNSGIIDKALVIGTDISKYALNSPGEPTQGAGAIAMVISRNPRIARISSKFGKVSGHVNDFFRTLYSENAEVFGKYSTDSYLNFILKAYDDFKQHTGPFIADYYVFHAPFGKMPVKSFQRIMFDRWLNDPIKKVLMLEKYRERVYTDKEKEMILSGKEELHPKTIEQLREAGFSDHDLFGLNYFYKDWLALKLMPCLDVPMRFGNMYSASLWAQLMHLIETRVKDGDEIYFSSYGSGATAISGMFKMQPNFRDHINNGPSVMDYIKMKRRVPVEYYEMYKRNLLPSNIQVGHVVAAPKNTHGLEISFCDHGCVLPIQEEIQYCPNGHGGVHKRWFPIYAVVDQIHQNHVEMSAHSCDDHSVYIFGDAEPGTDVQLSVRRMKVDDNPQATGYGLIHWYPAYTA